MESRPELQRTLGPVMLWGLGVGYVISGEYFGWNLGLPVGGTWGDARGAAGAFKWENVTQDALPHGWWGAFGAIPFAIWFYLAIEGVANAAEEARNPQREMA